MLHTRQAHLSLLVRYLNGVYTQAFHRRHGQVDLLQGRFKAIVVDRDAYLLAVCRDVEPNPARAGMVAEPGYWPWATDRAHAGMLGDGATQKMAISAYISIILCYE